MTNAAAQPLSIDVVSVQSQVVYGRVGNNVAMPTLQRFGLSAAAVPTVVLSNTPHYPSVHGGAIPLDWFAGYLDDLTARGGLRRLRGIVSGYLGSPEQAAVLARWIARTLETSRELRVLVDPVIGDHDSGIYVDPALIAAYREHLLPLADGLTPNGFELELLSGRPSTDADGVVAAARSLLRGRTRWVIVTSANPAAWEDGRMQIAVVSRDEAQWLTHPRLDIAPKGTGDVFSAAMLGGLLHGASVFEAAAAASEAVVAALRLTQRAGCAELLLPESPLVASGHSA